MRMQMKMSSCERENGKAEEDADGERVPELRGSCDFHPGGQFCSGAVFRLHLDSSKSRK